VQKRNGNPSRRQPRGLSLLNDGRGGLVGCRFPCHVFACFFVCSLLCISLGTAFLLRVPLLSLFCVVSSLQSQSGPLSPSVFCALAVGASRPSLCSVCVFTLNLSDAKIAFKPPSRVVVAAAAGVAAAAVCCLCVRSSWWPYGIGVGFAFEANEMTHTRRRNEEAHAQSSTQTRSYTTLVGKGGRKKSRHDDEK
jgi:cobalamin synthase